VTVAAACTGGVDLTSTPHDAALTTQVLGQPHDPERTGTERHVDLAKGEALLVKSGETVVSAFVYQGAGACRNTPGPNNPGLPTTGGRTMMILGAGSALLLVGTLALLFARRRRVTNVG
jgi:LPXTG-motif cell wall-anchored protein